MMHIGTALIMPMVVRPATALALFSGGMWDILANTSFFSGLIIIVLVIMSLVSWGIIISKYRLFAEVNRQSSRFDYQFSRANQLSDMLGQAKSFRLTPLSAIYSAGIKETDAIIDAKKTGALPEGQQKLSEDDFATVSMILDKTMSEEIGKLERYVVFLATTANAAPFLGLLGTVVGIMNSFWSIGERGSASLTVVAPGIAEALLATIIGLAAAIPAVIGYNWANNKLKYIHDQASNFSLEFLAQLKKDSYR